MNTLFDPKVVVLSLILAIGAIFLINANAKNQEVPEEVVVVPVAQPQIVQVNPEDLYWLAINIYHEARNEPLIGRIAVGVVTLNRVYDPRYPNTVKTVVTEYKQFSWYNNRKVPPPKNKKAWEDSQRIARFLLTQGYESDIVGVLEGATHFHAIYVNPKWAKTKTLVGRIGNHIFYRYERNIERDQLS